jgi:Flp pilus assembly protein TadB
LGVRATVSCARFKSNNNRDKEGYKMPLLQLLGVLIVVGILLWLVNRFIPMASSIKSILNVVVVCCVVFWLANAFGFIHSLSKIRVGR